MPAVEGGELAVVVGASGSFGTAIVDRLVGDGYAVLAIARDPDKLTALVSRHPAAVRAGAHDLAHDASIEAMRADIASMARPVRALVHGPGVAVAGGVATVPTAALLDAVDIKVNGLLRLVRAADPFLVDGSRIIAIAGHYGLEPTAYASAPGIANAALVNLVRQLSLAYGDRGVTAHAIAPGPADTERLHRVAVDRARLIGTTVDAVLDDMRRESSIGRLVTPEQVAWAVSVLLAPEATATTGATFMLDAGRRRGLP